MRGEEEDVERRGQVRWNFNANNSNRKQELGTKKMADKHKLHYILSVPVSALLYEQSPFESNPASDKGLSTH